MTDIPKTTYTNPLQTNNTIAMMVGYGAAVLASKFPFFDADVWNAIMLGIGGVGITIYTALINRKTKVVETAANLPEVKNIELDKKVEGVAALDLATPDNVSVSAK